MDIKYTYKEPEERPIEKATFESTRGADCEIMLDNFRGDTEVVSLVGHKRATFDKHDLADLIVLLQRFHRQLPEVENADTKEK